VVDSEPVGMSPEDVVALALIEEGRKRLAEGDEEGAAARFERAVAASPRQPRGYYFLAQASLLGGRAEQALAFLEKAELLFGDGAAEWLGEVYALRGAVYESLGDETRARAAYQQALAFSPGHLSALSGLVRLGEVVEREDQREQLPRR
jgi:tetratricopeptide (TPR) repeat protein